MPFEKGKRNMLLYLSGHGKGKKTKQEAQKQAKQKKIWQSEKNVVI